MRLIASDNDSGIDGKTSLVSFQATAATTYYVAVDGVRGVSGNVKLNYDLLGPCRLEAAPTATGEVKLRLAGQTGYSYIVEISPDFVNWAPFLRTNLTSRTVEFIDPTSMRFSLRYYRAVATR